MDRGGEDRDRSASAVRAALRPRNNDGGVRTLVSSGAPLGVRTLRWQEGLGKAAPDIVEPSQQDGPIDEQVRERASGLGLDVDESLVEVVREERAHLNGHAFRA